MFMGEYQHNIDAKGRMIVPAKFREGLGEKFVLTRGLDQCLFAYPMDEWKILEEKLKKLPLTKRDARRFTGFSFLELLNVKSINKEELTFHSLCALILSQTNTNRTKC